jgi:hypothetical protein
MERVGAAHGVRGAAGLDPGDPVRHFGRDVGQLGGAFGAELVEEDVQSGVVAARSRPHQTAGVVIDHDDEVAVAALVGDLVDPDPAEPVEPVNSSVDIGVDAGDDRPDGAPRDSRQLAHRGLRGSHREPSGQVVDVAGVPGGVARPRHRRHRRAVISTSDSGCVGLNEHLRGAEIQRPPPSTALTLVIAASDGRSVRTGQGSASSVAPTRRPRWPCRRTQRPRPPCASAHRRAPIRSISAPRPASLVRAVRQPEPKKQAGCTRGPAKQPPTDPSGGRLNCLISRPVVLCLGSDRRGVARFGHYVRVADRRHRPQRRACWPGRNDRSPSMGARG